MIDIKLIKFHEKIKALKDEIINEVQKLNIVLIEEYQYIPEHPMNKIDYLFGQYKYLAQLNFRWSNSIAVNNIEITAMFSKKGNKLVTKAVQALIKDIPFNFDNAKKIYNKTIKDISEKYSEVSDTAVREQIFWYLQPFIEIYEISFDKEP